ncbi:hypothetical protein CPC08DRAFT_713976 [Agrocybe pediades]|nr:hypothetical protein CPC08DRAFT_713976 [Agrocybe pediades]
MMKGFYSIGSHWTRDIGHRSTISGMEYELKSSDFHASDTGWAHSGTLLVGTQQIRPFRPEITLPVTHVDCCLSRPTICGVELPSHNRTILVRAIRAQSAIQLTPLPTPTRAVQDPCSACHHV